MSMSLMAWLGNAERELGHGEFRVLFRLCWHCNEETLLCCPSIDDLAHGSNMSPRSVYRAIDVLEERKYIAVLRERWPNGTQKVNRYTILANIEMKMPDGRIVILKASAEDAESRVTPMSPRSRVTPASKAGCQPRHPMNKEDLTRKDIETPEARESLFDDADLPAEPTAEEQVVAFVEAEWPKLKERFPRIVQFRKLQPDQRKKIIARAREQAAPGEALVDVWRRLLEYVPRSEFLRGDAPPSKDYPKPFGLTIDFLLRPKTFRQNLERADNDDGTDDVPAAQLTPLSRALSRRLERLADAGDERDGRGHPGAAPARARPADRAGGRADQPRLGSG